MKRLVQFFSVIILGISPMYSQNVDIPDANFLNTLVELGIDQLQIHKSFLAEGMEELQNNSMKKSLMNEEYQLDSILKYVYDTTIMNWIPAGWFDERIGIFFSPREIYTYDSQGNLLSTIEYIWDSEASDWVGRSKREFTYDAEGNQLSDIWYTWDSEASDWVELYKYEYTYDAEGNKLSYVGYDWDSEASDWVSGWKCEYTYDVEGNQLSLVEYDWDAATSDWVEWYKDWVERYKYEYTYDAEGNKLSYVGYDWDSEASDWVLGWKIEYTYDVEGNQLSLVEYDWDAATNDWVRNYKFEYTYDANGNRLSTEYYDWYAPANVWEGDCKNEYTYDAEGNQLSDIRYTWDWEARDFTGEWCKYEYTYDATGNLISRVGYDWDSGASDWVEDSKYEYTYDANGNQLSEVWDTGDSVFPDNIKTLWFYSKKVIFDISPASLTIGAEANSAATFNITSNTDWTISGLESWLSASSISGTGAASIILTAEANTSAEQRTANLIISGIDVSDKYVVVTQSGAIVGIDNQSYSDITIYPNPVIDILTILTGSSGEQSVRITSLNGQLVYSGTMEGDTLRIDMSPYSKGVYLIRISSREFVSTRKVIKL
ncbi:MAG: T9SS type A sorting domain-containing protein [Bacteroidota bacterium]